MTSRLHDRAGKPPATDDLVDVAGLVNAYYSGTPDVSDPAQSVSFGTSGHRGSSLLNSFNEQHILAIAQAICEYRVEQGITGPLFLGVDTHALSDPARTTALEVLVANGVEVCVDRDAGYTPTPVISRAILKHNDRRRSGLGDGIVITPSHNPPEDGGFKYNPPSGGPAESSVTERIQTRANSILVAGLGNVRRCGREEIHKAANVHPFDYVDSYVGDLAQVLDMEAIRTSGLEIGADPLGGSSIAYWGPIAERYGLSVTVVNDSVDPTFSFMRLDHDGKIRMDCSSPYAMSGLIALKDRFDIAFGNDTDADRHGIVTPSTGLLAPNHYLAVAIQYLFSQRPGWRPDAAVGKTVVSSSLIDRVAARLGRQVREVPVGFKWFVDGLLDGSYGFGGEESAGASFLCFDGSAWTTDKDGIVMDLLAAEMTARCGRDPGELYRDLVRDVGEPVYRRIDAPASAAERELLAGLSADCLSTSDLAGEKVDSVLTHAPGNGAPIGGLKVITRNGWFAARPSGTEDIYKIYAESFLGVAHLQRILGEAEGLIAQVFAQA